MFIVYRIGILLLFLSFTLSTACISNKKLTVGATALLLDEVAKASYSQSDLRVIREGMPTLLMLMDGMVRAWPDNDRLLIGASQGYSSYASAFVEDQDKDYAKVLYGRAKEYALKSLDIRGLKDPLNISFDQFKEGLEDFEQDDVPYMFWTATSWGSWIGLNMGSMEALAELPRVELLMNRVLELNEGFYHGGPHLLMGKWYALRPKMAGGDLNKSQQHFQRALELGQGRFLMTYVYYAYDYARRAFDKDLFISLLNKVIETPADIESELTLLNTVAKQKAKKMLESIEDYF